MKKRRKARMTKIEVNLNLEKYVRYVNIHIGKITLVNMSRLSIIKCLEID